jgi:hypothetical protein
MAGDLHMLCSSKPCGARLSAIHGARLGMLNLALQSKFQQMFQQQLFIFQSYQCESLKLQATSAIRIVVKKSLYFGFHDRTYSAATDLLLRILPSTSGYF